jgi:hypothetical protein
MKTLELRSNRSSGIRCHPIRWADTSQVQGFSKITGQLRDVEPYQFEISSNAHGRVHGFFLSDVFHIVWLDPDHKLYPRR